MIGYRKVLVWAAVFALCVVSALKAFAAGAVDLPTNVMNLIIWVTGPFMVANVAERLTDKYTLTKDGLQDSVPKP